MQTPPLAKRPLAVNPHRQARRLAAFAAPLVIASAWLGATIPATAQAQSFPANPIRLIIPFPPGGATDVIGRQLGLEMSKRLNQPVVVENRPGAAGIVGIKAASLAAADGYTIALCTPNTAAGDPALEKMSYNPATDLTAIAPVAAIPYVVFVNPGFPANTLQDLIAEAKRQPGKINFASSGTGGPPHLASELLKSRAAIDILHIPYKGAVPAVNDVVGGQIQMMTGDVNTALPFIQSGRLKALAVTGRERIPLLPSVPTVAESGLAGFEAEGWFGVFGPAKLPADITALLARMIAESVRDPEFIRRMEALGGRPMAMDRGQFDQYLAAERRTRATLIRDNKIVLDN